MREYSSEASGQHGWGSVDYQAIFNAMPESCAVLSAPDLRILGATDTYCAMLNVARADIVGRALTDIFAIDPGDPHDHGPKRLRKALARTLEDRIPMRLGIIRYYVRQPNRWGKLNVRWLRTTLVPVFRPNGELVHVMHHVEDVGHMLDVLEEAEVIASKRRH